MKYIEGGRVVSARIACTDLCVRALLLLAEEDVAVVKLTVDVDEIDRSDAALPAPAIRNHLVTRCIEYIEQRAIARNH